MATYTVASGGGNIDSASTYVGGVGTPGSLDTINFTTASGQLTVNTTTTIQDIDFSNYQNVITFNSSLIINRNIVFGDAGGNATYTVVTNANGDFRKTGNGTITANNKIWTGKLSFLPAVYTVTLNDKVTISGAVNVSGSAGVTITLSSANVLDPERFDVLGDFTYSGTSSALAGTALIKFTGTANQNISWTASGAVRNDIKIDKTGGTLSLSGTINYNTGTFTHVQGTVDAGTSTLNSIISTTFATNGITWNNVIFGGTTAQTFTFSNDFTIAGNLSLSGTTTTTLTGSNIFIAGNLSVTTTATISGTTLITFNGTGSQTWNHSAIGYLGTSVTINKTSGVLTLGSNVYYRTGTLTFVASGGTVDATSNTLNINASCTLATNGITWNNIIINGTSTITLTNSFNTTNFTINSGYTLSFVGTGLSISGNLTMGGGGNGAATFNVPNNLTITNFSTYFQSATNNYGLNGNTISITGNLTINMFSNYGVNGTTTLKMIGTGNLTYGSTNSGNFISNPFTIDTLGTITITGTINPLFSGSTITYTNGTVTGTGVIFSACTLNLNAGGQWGTDVTIRGATTLTSNATFGNLTTNTTAVTFSGAFTINVQGNLTINTSTSGASTPMIINGTGNQNWTANSYLSNNLTINKPSGTLTLGGNVYYNTGTLTHTLGDVDTTTNSNTFFTQSATINTSNITWSNFFFASGGANTMTLADNLYISNTFTCGGNGTISGAFNIYCGNCNINNSSSGATNTTITYSGIIYCSNNLTYSGNTGVSSITGKVYVGGSVFFNAPASTQGAGNIYMVGNGIISSLSISYPIDTNLYFDTSGKITISTPIAFANGAARIINLIRGNIDASKCDLYLNQNFNHTLTNMHKIAWKSVNVAGTTTILTMNEFFSGKPNLKTIVASSAGTNYTVTFTDNFEKIAKFVNISGCTLSRPQQLLVITDSKKSSTNTRGIKYINNLPNGISKGDPSIQNILTPGQSSNLLLGDPAFVKTI